MRFRRSLRWRVAFAYVVLLVASLGVSSVYLVGFVSDTHIDQLEERVEQETRLVSQSTASLVADSSQIARLQEVVEQAADAVDARVTIIAFDGRVLADSAEDAAQMENHADRPEVQDALISGLGTAKRVSATVEEPLLYTAVPIVVDGTVLGVARLAVSQADVDGNLNRIVATVLVVGIVVSVLAVVLGVWLVRRTVRSVRSVTEGARQLASGNLSHRVRADTQDETRELADTFNMMADELRTSITDLSTERNTLSALLETMADGVVLVNAAGRTEVVNNAARSLFGLEENGPGDGDFMSVIRDHDLQGLLDGSRQSNEQQNAEIEIPHSHRHVHAIATPVTDGAEGSVLLTLHDLTQARHVDQTRREFVSNVSHELRTPIASIKAMVESLEGGALSDTPAATDFLGRIHREVDGMADLVSDLLTLSRIESGQAIWQPSAVSMPDLAREVIKNLLRRAEVKSVEVSVQASNGLPQVFGEASQLRLVIGNLLDNAVKFSPEGGRVAVRMEEINESVQTTVDDTGPGVPPEHVPHLFERFYKVDRSRHDGGTGLGLSIARHIVEGHGGTISVQSRVGEGTSITFTIPVAKGE